MYNVISNSIGSRANIRNGRSKYLSAILFGSVGFSSVFEWMPQIFVLCRNFLALHSRRIGSNVSGMMKNPRAEKKNAMMAVIYSVHRQPRYDMVINPPTTGPATGPMNVAAANTATAIPRSTGSNISASMPPFWSQLEPKQRMKTTGTYNSQRRASKHASEKATDENSLKIRSHSDRDLENRKSEHSHKQRRLAPIQLRKRPEDERPEGEAQHK